MTEDEVERRRRRVEKYAKLQLVRRGVYFGLIMMSLVAYRFLPVGVVVCGVVIITCVSWYLESYCQVHEVRSYREYMIGYCELYEKPAPKSLPAERGYIKTLFSSWDISPFYMSVSMMVILCMITYSDSLVPIVSQGETKVTERRLSRLTDMNKCGHDLPSKLFVWMSCACSNAVTDIKMFFKSEVSHGSGKGKE